MSAFAELEISLHRREAGSYLVDFRFNQPESEADIRLGQEKPVQVTIDVQELHNLAHDLDGYSQKLTELFFSDPGMLNAFTQALASAQSLGLPLRLRLLIGPSAPELHSIRWEMIRNPQDNTPICTSENIIFSRYLSSLDWRPVRLRPKGDLTALVVVANPSDLGEYSLAEVDVDAETQPRPLCFGGY